MVDPDNIPPDIIEAARMVENFFNRNGIKDWCLMGVCSRSMYEKLKVSALNVTTEQTLEHVAGKLNG